jgi:hypothetical protein
MKHFEALLPLAQDALMRSWVVGWLGELLVADGQLESGFALVDAEIELAIRTEEPLMQRLAESDKVNLLLKVGRPAAALPLLHIEANDDPFFRTGQLLHLAEAHAGVGHLSESHDYLGQACANIEAQDIAHMRTRAETLAQRL